MTTNIANQVAFLRSSREFPTQDPFNLSLELGKSYIDTSNAVNIRTIGLFPMTQSAITGEAWFVTGNHKQQGFREVYPFSDSNLTFAHNLNLNSITNFIRIWGVFNDGTNWQTLPYVDVVSVTNQINVKVNATNVVITKGAGAPPAISNGLLVLEWIGNP